MPGQRTSTPAATLARVVVFAAFIAVLGLFPGIPVGVLGIPIVLQNMGPLLAGSVIGPRQATAATLLFLALTALGLPLLTGGRGGLGPFVAPSAGFLVGYVLSALVTGLVVARLPRRSFLGLLAAVLAGVVADYVPGVAVPAFVLGSLPAAAFGSLIYVPGDVVKAVLVALVAATVHRALPGTFPARRRTAPS